MARESNATQGNLLRVGSALGITAYPLTIACWVWPDTLGATDSPGIVWLGDASAVDQYFCLQLRGDQSDRLDAVARITGTNTAASTSNAATEGAWNHICGTYTSTTSRRAILNGNFGSSGTDTTSCTFPTGLDRTSVFQFDDASPGENLDGRVAEVGIWDVVLTDDEILALASGWSPLRIRPSNLQGYWPLFGQTAAGEPDFSGGGNNFAEVGTVTVADHSPTGPPFGFYAPAFQEVILPGTVSLKSGFTRVTDVENTGTWAELGGGAGSSFTQDFVVQNAWARGRRVDNAVRGFGFDNTTGIDLVDAAGTEAHVFFWIGVTTFAGLATLASGGGRIRLGGSSDPDTTPWAEWNVLGGDTYPSTGGYTKVALHIARDPDAISGSLDKNSVRMWAGNFNIADVGGNAPNAHIDSIEYAIGSSGLVVDGGSGGDPAKFVDFVNFEATAANGYGVVIERDSVLYVNARLCLGDATATIFNDSGQLVVFGEQEFAEPDWMGLTVDLQNNTTDVDLASSVVRSGGATIRGDFAVIGTGGACDFEAVTLDKLRRVKLSGSDTTLDTCRISSSGQVDVTNSDFSGSMDLPGTNEYVDTQENIDLNNTSGDFAVLMRVKATDWSPTAIETLASHYGGTIATESFRLQLLTTGALRLIVSDGAAETTLDSDVLGNAGAVLADNSWQWIRVDYDQSAGQASFFVGQYDTTADAVNLGDPSDTPLGDVNWHASGTPTGTSRSMPTLTRPLLIGAENDGTPANFFDGEVSFFELWTDGFRGAGDLRLRADWRTGPDFTGSPATRADDFDGANFTWEEQGTAPVYTQGDNNATAASLVDSTIADSTAEVALLWNVNTDPDGELNGVAFESAGTGHAIELGPNTPATITLRGHEYVGYATSNGSTGNEVFYNNSGKAITINLVDHVGGTGSVRNGTGASTTVQVSVSLAIRGLVENSRVDIFGVGGAEDGNSILSGYANSAGEVTGTFGGTTPQNVAIKVRKAGIIDSFKSDHQNDDPDFTDWSLDARDATGANDVGILGAAGSLAVNDAAYFGSLNPFGRIWLDIETAGSFTATLVWEFWNGSSWETINFNEIFGFPNDTTDAKQFKTAGWQYLDFVAGMTGTPHDFSSWATSAVDGYTAYWMRARVSSHTTTITLPDANEITLGRVIKYKPIPEIGTQAGIIQTGTGLDVTLTQIEDDIND